MDHTLFPNLHCLSLQTVKLHCLDPHPLHVVQDQHYVLPWTVSVGTRSEGSGVSVTDSVTVPLQSPHSQSGGGRNVDPGHRGAGVELAMQLVPAETSNAIWGSLKRTS